LSRRGVVWIIIQTEYSRSTHIPGFDNQIGPVLD